MKFEKSAARKMKHRALLWLRLEQRCAFIATEAGNYSADVLGVNEKKIIEVEVKVSLEDIKADFKKWKHTRYHNSKGSSIDLTSGDSWVPTHFYFAVPPELVEPCKAEIEKRGFAPYGVIDSESWKVIKRADWLHKREPSSKVKFVLALRMGSELLRFHEAML